jgi:acyl-CoA reductase-like NAD-dependent aldehyde dehydrogenase
VSLGTAADVDRAFRVRVVREIGHIAADRILPLTPELGGNSANIVFADADLDFAATEAVRSQAKSISMRITGR